MCRFKDCKCYTNTMKFYYFIILIYMFIEINTGQEDTNCNVKETCSKCIQTPNCIWCSELINSPLNSHCVHKNISNRNAWCSPTSTYAPEQNITIILNNELRSRNVSSQNEAILMKPQKVKIRLRQGEEFSFDFQYRQAQNYPVDLYYIMDLSKSMETHREKLAKLGGKLAEAMRKLTDDFQIGFGSFVDKTEMPFIDTEPQTVKKPCTFLNDEGITIKCIPPYSFKNHMSLNFNDTAFAVEVSRAEPSINVDFPEGGFDAIMQAMVCKDVIGWRDKARHLIVFSTDADYHMAGDGKLAGVVEPNDAQCHMTNNMYTHDLVYGYPSVSHINYVAKQKNINLILAIVSKRGSKGRVYKVYEELHERIDNSGVGALTDNSDNVVKLVQENYSKIVNSVVMTDNSESDIEIKYSSNCSQPKENGCNNVHAGDIISFTASIRMLKCPSNGSAPRVIKIKPEGVDESMELELEVICDCPCEKQSSNEAKNGSALCSNYGDLKCGICSCHSGRFGRSCECDNTTSSTNDDSACIIETNGKFKICSGYGSCRCGKCECLKRSVVTEKYYGQFCECDNFSCKRNEGKLCSGIDRGTCDCGKCQCLAGWKGKACECSDTNSTCIAPGSNAVCSGHGECICGECKCSSDEGTLHKYSEQYCGECPSCPGERCEEIRSCVECQAFRTGSYNADECFTKCTSFTSNLVEKIEEQDLEDIKVCRSPDSFECTIIYQYTYNNEKQLLVDVQRTKICSEGLDVIMVVSSVIGSILLAGIIMLIIWKVFTVVHDRREYNKFEKERAGSEWHGGGNPLYKKATSEFKNPLYDN